MPEHQFMCLFTMAHFSVSGNRPGGASRFCWSAVMRVEDYYSKGKCRWVLPHEKGGTLENAQAMTAHEGPRTTKLYDQTGYEITFDKVERIVI